MHDGHRTPAHHIRDRGDERLVQVLYLLPPFKLPD